MAERVYIDPARTSAAALSALGLSPATVSRTLRRGWFAVDYHRRGRADPAAGFDVDAAYGIAYSVYRRYFMNWWPHQDDLIQEAVVRCWETSARSMDRGYLWTVARNTMRDYVDRLKWPRETLAMEIVEAALEAPLSEEQELLAWLRGLAGEACYDAALGGDRSAIENLKSLYREVDDVV